MNNKIFISRCEIILTTMRASGCQKATTKQIAKWLNIAEGSASQVIAKACKQNILNKKGAASNTYYVLTDGCSNSLEQQINTGKDINAAVTYVVNWFVNKQSKISAKKVTSVNGKEFVKVKSAEELDAVSKQSIENILVIINQNKELRAHVELLQGEIDRLKPYEEYYKRLHL